MPPPDTFSENVKHGHIMSDHKALKAYWRNKEIEDGTYAKRARRGNSSGGKKRRRQSVEHLGPMQARLLRQGEEIGLHESELMDALQDLNLVSDETVWLEEVAESDCEAAMLGVTWITFRIRKTLTLYMVAAVTAT